MASDTLSQQSDYQAANAVAYAQINAQVNALSQKVIPIVENLGPLQSRVLELMRKELALDRRFDRTRYLAVRAKAVAAATAFSKAVRDAVDALDRPPEP